MNVERMKKLAAHLNRLPKRAFRMESWITAPSGRRWSIRGLRRADKNRYECGMAACVGGHAALLFADKDWNCNVAGCGRKPCISEESVGAALGLCRSHAIELTNPTAQHQTPKAAAKFIRALVAENPECCR